MIKAFRTDPIVIELIRRTQDTQVFLRMAAIELRRMAKEAPDIAAELRHVAQEIQAAAEDLARGHPTNGAPYRAASQQPGYQSLKLNWSEECLTLLK